MSTVAEPPRERSGSRGGRPRAGSELTGELIGTATLAVIRANGTDQLTRQRVADELAVSARALYRLAPSTDHLLAAAGAQWQQQWPPPPDTGDWAADLRLWSQTTLAHARAYPGLPAATQRLPIELLEDRSEAVVTAVIGVLMRAGFDQPAAMDAFGVLSMHCLGWAAVFTPEVASSTPDEADAVPWLEEHLDFRQRGFLVGLDLLLAGLGAKLSA
ncbi:MAG: TetR family transcriptional regulator [Actinomycetota bacterium]